jgi:hypothetical protein
MPAAVGVFGESRSASEAIEELLQRGFRRDDISTVGRRAEGSAAPVADTGASGTVTGIAAGSVLGAFTGLLLGIGSLAIPGLGPLLAAGPLVTTLTGTAIGAAAGGLLGALIDLGVPAEPAASYQAMARGGHVLVTVRTEDPSSADLAAEIMRRHNVEEVDSIR